MYRNLLKELFPPFILKRFSNLFYGWSGDYLSWKEASDKCGGYKTDVIFNKVKSALEKVKKGEAVYERDSVLFDKVQYSFPLLSALSQVALRNKGKLNLLDFGGSMGSSYYQNRSFFQNLQQFNWCVVEQPHFVEEGNNTFADDHLHFFYDINSCLSKYSIDVILLSSVIQYIENPMALLEFISSKKIDYLILDRTPVLLQGSDRITIQKVPSSIYKAKYPCWLLNEDNMLAPLLKDYSVIFEGQSEERIYVKNAVFKFYFLKRK